MNHKTYMYYVLIMAVTTYFIRVLPFAFIKKDIKNKFVQSFLAYIPYTVLAAMTFPAILGATSYMISAFLGMITAIVVAYFNKGLVKVAAAACVVVLITETILSYI